MEMKRVQDGFYEECLLVGKVDAGNQELRLAVVKKDNSVGLDIRKFSKKSGKPTSGLMLPASSLKDFVGMITNLSSQLPELIEKGIINFDSYDKEDITNG